MLQLPASSYASIAAHSCVHCGSKSSATHIRSAGVEVINDDTCRLFYDLACPTCHVFSRFLSETALSSQDWAKELAFACGYIVLHGKRPLPDRFLTTRNPPPGMKLILRSRSPSGPPNARKLRSLAVFGGYRDAKDGHIYLLCRWVRERHEFDGLFRLEKQNRIRLVDRSVRTSLPNCDWDDFLYKPASDALKIGRRVMAKLSNDEIELLIRDRMYRLSNRLTADSKGDQQVATTNHTVTQICR